MNSSGVTAFINAGGPGTRLQPLFPTNSPNGLCKAMLNIPETNVRMIEYQVWRLLCAGIDQIMVEFGSHHDAAQWTLKRFANICDIRVQTFDQALESAGGLIESVRKHIDWFDELVYVVNHDTLLHIDDNAFIGHHVARGATVSIALTRNTGVPNEGKYWVNGQGQVIHSAETRSAAQEPSPPADLNYRASSTGAVLLNRDVVADSLWQEEMGPSSLYYGDFLVPPAIAAGSMYGYDNGKEFFMDIGTVESWHRFSSLGPSRISEIVMGSFSFSPNREGWQRP